jgi:hypothetical protein
MPKHDLGYYVDVLLRRDEAMSLFPEFYKLFYKYTVSGILSDLRFHPAYKGAITDVAEQYEADPEELDEALESVLDVIIEAERENHFALVWDFIYYFEGTQIDVPTRQEFERVLLAAKIYVRVIRADNPDAEVKAIAAEGPMTPSEVRGVVEYVQKMAGDDDEAIRWQRQRQEEKEEG